MMYDHFDYLEIACRCGCGHLPKKEIVLAAEAIRKEWGRPVLVSSGARCAKHNAGVGGAKNSAHVSGEALDIRPQNLDQMAEFHKLVASMLEKLDIYMEDPKFTRTWCHIQTRVIASGKRIFKP